MSKEIRPDILDHGPMRHAPTNELGVVFLFAHFAKKWRMRIDEIRSAFPDCIAYRKAQGGEKRVRIEFEYRSKNFKQHGHSARACDIIVCWEHNWPGAPKSLEVIELRKHFGLGFNVWIQPTGSPYKEVLDDLDYAEWSVASEAHKGDLVLMYRTSPDKLIRDVFVLVSDVGHEKANWKKGKDYGADIRRVATLGSPIHLEDLQRHRVLGEANFVRGCMRYRPRATSYWPYIFDIIVTRNPTVSRKLSKYSPEKLNL